MQCPYCGRDIPDDARWCPYCGGEQTPPEDDLQNEILPPEDQQDASAPPDDGNGEHLPSGWQDSAPADDWDDEAEPQDDPWADDPPVPGWENDAPYEPAPEDRDAPRSKALLIAIFALQDSFGTACNVTGDGALTLMLEGLFNRNGELGPLQDVAPAEKI